MSAACLASDNFAWRTHCAAKYPVLACCADWWSKSDFVLNELNVQSVVTAPAHDEMIPLSASGTYTVKGFAYSGACYPLHANSITDTVTLQCNICLSSLAHLSVQTTPDQMHRCTCVSMDRRYACASSNVSADWPFVISIQACILCGWGYVMELECASD